MSMAGRNRRVRRLAVAGLAAAAAAGSLVAVNAIARADQADPTDLILGADDPDAIAGEYLVVLDEAAPSALGLGGMVEEVVDEVAGPVEVVDELGLIDGFVAEMSPEEAAELAADDAVAYVEQNRTVSISDVQQDPPSWGLDRVDQSALPLDDAYEYEYTGAGTTAYILDTGINLDHEEFAGRLAEGYDAIDSGGDGDDCNGHGTHVAGTVGGTDYGLAKDVTLVPVRVLNCEGSGSYAGIISGIDWITENAAGPSVANMSLGGPFSQALNDTVAGAVDAGVAFAIAAGNEGQDACNVSPASERSAITVGATDDRDGAASFSNFGECVDILAPGVNITSAWIGGADAASTISGTSMAAPHVAGAAALYLEADPEATPEEVAEALASNAVEGAIPDPAGSPNLLLNTEFLVAAE
ncbi:S8 family peptidase [Glycomyces salinus]|uniref:S8 family peptidase n=1 Tax=Glycomyces salinus TaxID=980294 RepID=UPI0018ECFCF8|nr:S8 family peptidase [Glycomyces salinus]